MQRILPQHGSLGKRILESCGIRPTTRSSNRSLVRSLRSGHQLHFRNFIRGDRCSRVSFRRSLALTRPGHPFKVIAALGTPGMALVALPPIDSSSIPVVPWPPHRHRITAAAPTDVDAVAVPAGAGPPGDRRVERSGTDPQPCSPATPGTGDGLGGKHVASPDSGR